jgi:hypothetical protein
MARYINLSHPITDRTTNLAAPPDDGSSAVPAKIQVVGTFPGRAFARLG